jgi:hypothetical protein
MQDPGIGNPVQFMYIPVDSKESGIPLPPIQVCYSGRVVSCRWETAEREHDAVNHNISVSKVHAASIIRVPDGGGSMYL